MKNILLILCMLFAIGTSAQEIVADTVAMRNPNHVGTKPKITKVKTKGEELAAHSFTDIATHVSLLRDIPVGRLESVTFYFNSGLINLSKKSFGIDYQDTTLAVVIYSVGEDGRPGTVISNSQLQFVVGKDHKGAIKIDLSGLQLQSQKQLFIGLSAVNKQTGNHVVLKTRAHKNAVSYVLKKRSAVWEEYSDGTNEKYAVNMVLGVGE